MQDSLYPVPEQLRRYSSDNSPYYFSQSTPYPSYCMDPSNDYSSQELSLAHSKILSFSEGKKKKGDVMDFYVKYKTEVIHVY